jgi:hypothetical protein
LSGNGDQINGRKNGVAARKTTRKNPENLKDREILLWVNIRTTGSEDSRAPATSEED